MKTDIMNLIDSPNGDPADSKNIVCKFVLVVWQNCLILVIGPVARFPYHANLLEKFCKSHQLPCVWTDRPAMLEVLDQKLRILGGGWAELQPKQKEIRFRGRSTAYGKFNREDLESVLKQDQVCEGFSPRIDD